MENKFIRALRIREKIMTKKLYAAICLLLVATLFISSASYAWFVLSTAPEATGVNTTLGSNGNLEIALNTNDLSATELNGGEDIPAGLETFYEKNPYWGNLIDLSDERYGLQEIELKPSILNFVDNAQQILNRESPIRFARYDADGRVVSVNASSAVATYNGETGDFTGNANYGVRAAGEKYPAVALTAGRTENSVRNAYAFCIDLLFRTNVTNANLLLQIEGIDRIYTEENAPDGWEYNEGVKGNGSNITVGNEMLQEALRVVFTDTLTGEVYATAAADSEGNLYLLDDPNSVVIKPLVQNQVSAISVWIYLDGSLVENLHADTAAATDLKINLQFATDVELNPAFGNSNEWTYYLTHVRDDIYAIYAEKYDGSYRSYVAFRGTVDETEHSVVFDSMVQAQDGEVYIPAVVINKATGEEYAVSINPDDPFACSPTAVTFVPVKDTKVGISNTDLSNLFGVLSTSFQSLDLRGLDTSSATNMSNLFAGCCYLTELKLDGLDTSNVTDMSGMFGNCTRLRKIDLNHFDTSNVTDMSRMFAGCEALKELYISNFDTSNVTTMESMFACCRALTAVDVSGFDTVNVTDMSLMFDECKNIESIAVENFDTSNVTVLACMFRSCEKLAHIDVSNFITSNVTNINAMFESCVSLTEIDLSNFDTANVTLMNSVFNNCVSLTSLDISSFDTFKVTDMTMMFGSCRMLEELDVSHFNTANVRGMYQMFAHCTSLRYLDLSNWDMSNADTEWMFLYCTAEVVYPES